MKWVDLISNKWFRLLATISVIVLSYYCVKSLLDVYYFKLVTDQLQTRITLISTIVLIPCIAGTIIILFKTKSLSKEGS